MNITTIYFDMDNVCVDFESHFKKITGYDWNDTDGVNNSWERLNHASRINFFRDMPTMEHANDMLAVMTLWGQQCHFNTAFLTALPIRTSFASWKDEKIQWVKEHPSSHIRAMDVIVTNRAQDKQEYARPDTVLVDDNPLNIQQWRDKGGIAVHHTSWARTFSELRDIIQNAQ